MQYIFLRIYLDEIVVKIIKLAPNIRISGKWDLRPATRGGTGNC